MRRRHHVRAYNAFTVVLGVAIALFTIWLVEMLP